MPNWHLQSQLNHPTFFAAKGRACRPLPTPINAKPKPPTALNTNNYNKLLLSEPVSSTSCVETGSTNPTSTAKPETARPASLKPKTQIN